MMKKIPKIAKGKKKQKKLSKCVHAFELFKEKKRLSDIVITHDLDADTVLYHYRDFLRLTRMYNLTILHDNLGKDLTLFIHIYNRAKKERISHEDIEDLIHIQRSTGEMQNAVGWFNKHIS